MTRPDLDAIAALLDKATQQEGAADTSAASLECLLLDTQEATNARDTLIAALPALLAYVRELELHRAPIYEAESAQIARSAALAMRERCAQACEERALIYDGLESGASTSYFSHKMRGARTAAEECAAAILALEP